MNAGTMGTQGYTLIEIQCACGYPLDVWGPFPPKETVCYTCPVCSLQGTVAPSTRIDEGGEDEQGA